MECPTCNGAKHCLSCKGKGECTDCGGNGCERCAQTGECNACGGWGYCPECEGTGEVPIPVETGLSTGNELLASDYFEVTRTGIKFLGDAPQSVWESTVKSLLEFWRSFPWIIGDLILHGEDHYGETYSQAIEITGLEYNTLAKYVWVCKAVPYEMRRADLSFEHHRKVAVRRLPQTVKKNYLDRAKNEKWSSSKLAEVIEEEGQDVEEEEKEIIITTCACPICGANGDEGWKLTALSKVECSHCHAKGRELVDRVESYAALLEAFDAQARELAELRALLDAHPKKETVNE